MTTINDLPGPVAAEARQLGQMIRRGESVNLTRAWQMKRELTALLGPGESFDCYKMIFSPGRNVKLRHQKILRLGDIAGTEAETLRVIHPGGREVRLEPPRTVGPAQIFPIQGRSRGVIVACFRDATAYARSSTIRLADGRFVFDVEGDELSRIPADLSFDPVVLQHGVAEGRRADEADPAGDDELLCLDARRPTTVLRLPEALAILGTNAASFGHWLAEEFPRFLAARQLPELEGVPILVDADIPAQHVEMLRAFTGPGQPVIEVPRFLRVEAERLWVATNWFYSPKMLKPGQKRFPDLGALAYAVDELAALFSGAWQELETRIATPGPGPGRVFVSRDPERYRHITNQAEITALLAGRGFDELRPETASFVEQFRRYRGAERIVVQSGSAEAGMVMCRPGTKVLMLGNGRTPFLAVWSGQMRALGIDATVFAGQIEEADAALPDRSNYSIDPRGLEKVLDEFLEGA